jgi:hypothetical protein
MSIRQVHEGHVGEGLDGGLTLGSVHVAGFAETLTGLQLAHGIAAAHHRSAPRNDHVEAIVHLAFPDDLLGLLVPGVVAILYVGSTAFAFEVIGDLDLLGIVQQRSASNDPPARTRCFTSRHLPHMLCRHDAPVEECTCHTW